LEERQFSFLRHGGSPWTLRLIDRIGQVLFTMIIA
jgi:hypothetical protein